jgi:hypothetical protein
VRGSQQHDLDYSVPRRAANVMGFAQCSQQ